MRTLKMTREAVNILLLIGLPKEEQVAECVKASAVPCVSMFSFSFFSPLLICLSVSLFGGAGCVALFLSLRTPLYLEFNCVLWSDCCQFVLDHIRLHLVLICISRVHSEIWLLFESRSFLLYITSHPPLLLLCVHFLPPPLPRSALELKLASHSVASASSQHHTAVLYWNTFSLFRFSSMSGWFCGFEACHSQTCLGNF